MNAGEWAGVGVFVLAGIGLACYLVYREVRTRSWCDGYRAGQWDERKTVAHKLAEFAERGLAAQRGVDYLYEHARQEIRQTVPDSASPERDDHP